MDIIWYGTASIGIQTEHTKLVVDPFLPLKGSKIVVDHEEFQKYRHVLITHGHFDHIQSLTELYRNSGTRIYATSGACKNIRMRGLSEKRLRKIAPGKSFRIGDIRVTPYMGKHIRFDKELIRDTILNRRMLCTLYNVPAVTWGLLSYPERGETVGYLLEAEGKRIFLLGSLGLRDGVDYPTGMDVLVLPYQGNSNLFDPAVQIIERLKPRKVILDHWDDTFPPITQTVDLTRILEYKCAQGDGKDVEICSPEHGMWMKV